VFVKLFALGVLWSIPFLAHGQAVTPDWAEAPHPQYMLAPKDHILIRTPQAKKLDGRIFQIQADGFVTLPAFGRVQAAGLRLVSFENYIAGRLRKHRSADPAVHIVVINFKEHRSRLKSN
jgi:protein involved in polysaccharide export with SLBB domain